MILLTNSFEFRTLKTNTGLFLIDNILWIYQNENSTGLGMGFT